MPIVPNQFVLLVVHFIIGMGYACTFPLLMGLSIQELDNNQRATAMGIFQAIYGIGIMIGPGILGAIIENYSIQYGFLTLSAICLIAIYIVIKFVPKEGSMANLVEE